MRYKYNEKLITKEIKVKVGKKEGMFPARAEGFFSILCCLLTLLLLNYIISMTQHTTVNNKLNYSTFGIK